MDLTPDQIASASFRVVRKGFDPDEVRAFQGEAARALDNAVQFAAVVGQRAKAAADRAQQVDQSGTGSTVTHGVEYAPAQPALTSSTVSIRADDVATIGRTLLLAQRTAEQTVAEANEQAAAIRSSAEADALRARSDVELETARLLADARTHARRAGDAERSKVIREVNELLARLDFLREDVRAMETYAGLQRQRLVEAADAMRSLAENTVGGIAGAHSPALSSAAETLRAEASSAVLSPVDSSVPVMAQDPVKVASAAMSSPSAGSTSTVPFTLSFSDEPTGEVAPIRPTSGPISVPELDDWNEPPSVRMRIVTPKNQTPSE